MSERESLTAVRDRLQEEFDNLTYPVQWGTFMLGRVAQLEAENQRLNYKVEARDKEINALLRTIDRMDALKEGSDE